MLILPPSDDSPATRVSPFVEKSEKVQFNPKTIILPGLVLFAVMLGAIVWYFLSYRPAKLAADELFELEHEAPQLLNFKRYDAEIRAGNPYAVTLFVTMNLAEFKWPASSEQIKFEPAFKKVKGSGQISIRMPINRPSKLDFSTLCFNSSMLFADLQQRVAIDQAELFFTQGENSVTFPVPMAEAKKMFEESQTGPVAVETIKKFQIASNFDVIWTQVKAMNSKQVEK